MSSQQWKDGQAQIGDLLHEAVTRDLCFEMNGEGHHYYYIREGIKIVYTSDRFDDVYECGRDGFRMLAQLHEQDPLRHDDGTH